MITSSELNKILTKTKTATFIFKDMAARERFRREYNLKKLFKDLMDESKGKIDEKEFVETFKDLEKAGLGSIVIGRGGKVDRFIWNYNLKDVARAAKGEIEPKHIEELKRSQPPTAAVTPSNEVEAASGDSALDVIIIQPYGTGVERIRISSDKAALFRNFLKVLNEK